jgi:hypothetical protein
MLSDQALAYLATRIYRPGVSLQINVIPLGGIYWEDEYPFLGEPDPDLPEEDVHQIWRMFVLRVCQWRGETLPEEAQQFWDAVHAKAPAWALFQRMKISSEELEAQEFGARKADEFEAAFAEGADEIEVTEEGGIRQVKAIFDLAKEEPGDSRHGPTTKPRIQ